MLEKEVKLGNYLKSPSCKFSHLADARETMVQMIEEIHKIKNYREETLYIAINIADKLLCLYAEEGREAPSLIQLGMVCTLIAAKLNQPK